MGKTRWDIEYEGDSLIIDLGRPDNYAQGPCGTILDRRLGDVLSEAINESVDALLDLLGVDLSLGDILDTRIVDILDFIGGIPIEGLPIVEMMMVVPPQSTVGSLASQLYDGFRALGIPGAGTPGAGIPSRRLAAPPTTIGDFLDDSILNDIPVRGSLNEILGQVINNIASLQLTETQTVGDFVESALDFVGHVLVDLLSILDPPNEGETQCLPLIASENIGAGIICRVVNIAANIGDLIRDHLDHILDALNAITHAITQAITFIVDAFDMGDDLLDDAAGYLMGLLDPIGDAACYPPDLSLGPEGLDLAVPIFNILTTEVPGYGLVGDLFVQRDLLGCEWIDQCGRRILEDEELGDGDGSVTHPRRRLC